MPLLQTTTPWIALLVFLATTFSAGLTGLFFKPGAWYATLSKPAWTPPNALFPAAWTLLYVCMAIAVWWVALSPGGAQWQALALALWSWQMVLNALWSPIFFGQHRIDAALAIILGLWAVLVASCVVFFLVSPIAGALMLPYLVWVSYAALLNFAIWRRNPS